MKAKHSNELAMVQSFFRFSALILLGGILLFSLGMAPANAKTLYDTPHDGGKSNAAASKFGMQALKNGCIKITARNLNGSTVKMKVHYVDYESHDSVVVIRKRNDCWYCFSLKSGVISEPYISMGFPGTTLNGKQLIACVDKSQKLGFLDCNTGKEVIPCRFYYDEDYYDEGYRFVDNSPYFEGNLCLLQMQNDNGGVWDCIIDTNGKILLEGRPDIRETEYFDGYIVERIDDLKSLYDKDLQCVLSGKEYIADYKVGIPYSDSLGAIPMLVDHKLTKTTPVYTLVDVGECETLRGERKSEESEGSAEYYTFDIDYRLGAGVIDRDMNLVIDPNWKWDRVVPIGNGYFVCYSDYTGFLMDSYGNFVVPKTRQSGQANR